jgi:hypothetical protein
MHWLIKRRSSEKGASAPFLNEQRTGCRAVYRLRVLMLLALLTACDQVAEHKPDSVESAPSQQVVDEAVSDAVVAVEEDNNKEKDNDNVVVVQPWVLDLAVPPLAPDEVEHLSPAPKVDIGNVFSQSESQPAVSVSAEPLLNIEKAGNGKEKVMLDGAKMTVEKPIR